MAKKDKEAQAPANDAPHVDPIEREEIGRIHELRWRERQVEKAVDRLGQEWIEVESYDELQSERLLRHQKAFMKAHAVLKKFERRVNPGGLISCFVEEGGNVDSSCLAHPQALVKAGAQVDHSTRLNKGSVVEVGTHVCSFVTLGEDFKTEPGTTIRTGRKLTATPAPLRKEKFREPGILEGLTGAAAGGFYLELNHDEKGPE